jgi:hypothetical protein
LVDWSIGQICRNGITRPGQGYVDPSFASSALLGDPRTFDSARSRLDGFLLRLGRCFNSFACSSSRGVLDRRRLLDGDCWDHNVDGVGVRAAWKLDDDTDCCLVGNVNYGLARGFNCFHDLLLVRRSEARSSPIILSSVFHALNG